MNPFYILITLVLNLFITAVVAFVPTSRYFQDSVVISNKIYYFGGIGVSGKGSNELFYLDASSSLNIVNPNWTDLTIIAPIPVSSAFSPSCVGGINNATIFLFEHRSTNTVNSTTLVTFSFDTTTQKWLNTATTGVAPPSRQEMKAVTDKNGRIYISGGFDPYTTQKSYNNTYVLDSMSLSWLSSYPTTEIDMTKLSIYNTISGTWSSVVVAGIGGTLVVGGIVAGLVGFICYRKYRRDPDDDLYVPTPGSMGDREHHEYDEPVDYVPTPGTNIREARYSVSTPSPTMNRYGTPSYVSNTSSVYDAPNFAYQSGAPDATFIPSGIPTPGNYNQGAFTQGPIQGVYNQGAFIQGGPTHGYAVQNVPTDGIPTPGTRSIYSSYTNNS
ncbi:1203_t:CDS:2 [Cetraspora pellucida]|uniref:1203_t:CDS:1 n=1 Tax=Cetraspora pellucida TaxID=1433469 RepID=A0A9N9DXV3_9GLOM|nr:1203_t:CDS:2 [Cetraspora pellucida]